MPGTLSVCKPMSEIKRPMLSPCSPSGIALPTITSSTSSLSICGNCVIKCSMTFAAKSSGRTKRKPPLLALPTAVLYPAMMYAFMCGLNV